MDQRFAHAVRARIGKRAFGLQAQAGKRRAQLMRRVGDETILQFEQAAQAREQQIDRARQRPDLDRHDALVERRKIARAPSREVSRQRIEQVQAAADAEPDQDQHQRDQARARSAARRRGSRARARGVRAASARPRSTITSPGSSPATRKRRHAQSCDRRASIDSTARLRIRRRQRIAASAARGSRRACRGAGCARCSSSDPPNRARTGCAPADSAPGSAPRSCIMRLSARSAIGQRAVVVDVRVVQREHVHQHAAASATPAPSAHAGTPAVAGAG